MGNQKNCVLYTKQQEGTNVCAALYAHSVCTWLCIYVVVRAYVCVYFRVCMRLCVCDVSMGARATLLQSFNFRKRSVGALL